MRPLASELPQAKYETQAFNFKWKYQKLATVRVRQNTQNLVISSCCFTEDG